MEALRLLGVALDTPVAATGFDLKLASFQVSGLGSLCADSVRNVSNALAPFNFANPVDIGIVASGVIRDPIYAGNTGAITFSDVYNSLPLGISPYQQSPPVIRSCMRTSTGSRFTPCVKLDSHFLG